MRMKWIPFGAILLGHKRSLVWTLIKQMEVLYVLGININLKLKLRQSTLHKNEVFH